MPSYNFPQNANYFFLTPSIEEGFGGLTNAMLKRGRLFFEKENIGVKILTFHYNPDFDAVRIYLEQTKKVNEGMTVLNLYEFLLGDRKLRTHKDRVEHSIVEDDQTFDKVKDKNAYRYFKNGLYTMYKSFERQDGTLKFIDFFNEHRSRTRREEYDRFGQKRKSVFMDLSLNVPKQEIYYDENGVCFLSKWFKIQGDKSQVERIQLFDQNGCIKKVFKSDIELQTYWLNSLVCSDHPNFMVVDGRAMDSLVLTLPEENIYKVFVKHSIHVRPPYEPHSVLRLGNRKVFENVDKPDAIVSLTEAQKKDMEIRFGVRNNYFVIPHSYLRPDEFPAFSKRDPLKVVVMARYHEEKQLDHIIKAFEKVVKKVPEASLDLYGFGKEEQKLQKLIEKLGLLNNVYLRGQTESPHLVFENAALSILTSKYEGFGLVILESLAHGCPVVAYDIKYGPSDMISGDNGSLVPNGDIDKLGEEIANYLLNPEKLREASRAAYDSSLNFSDEAFMTRWGNLFQTIMKQKGCKNSIKSIELYLSESDWSNKVKGIYKIDGRLSLKGSYSIETISDCKISLKLQNRETKETIMLKSVSFEFKNKDEIKFSAEIPLLTLHKEQESCLGFWDVSVVLNWNNSYFEKRIGYKKSKEAAKEKKRVKTPNKKFINPYYTKPYGNLSFHINDKNDVISRNGRVLLRKVYNKLFNSLNNKS